MLNNIGSEMLSKLGKDELYTFLFGFGLGLFYYLPIFVVQSDGKFVLTIGNIFEAILILVAFGLLATLILYTLYSSTFALMQIYASSKLEDPNAGRWKIDISTTNPLAMVRIDVLQDVYGHTLHLWGLIYATYLLLIPALWLFPFSGNQHKCWSCFLTFLLLAFAIYTICWKISPLLITYLKIDSMTSSAKIKITTNPQQYCDFMNSLVDASYFDQLKEQQAQKAQVSNRNKNPDNDTTKSKGG